jgi:micrococcal nuclease
VRAYDGDTITVDIDLGLNVWLKDQTLRLFGIDTPEVRGLERPDGLVARDHVRSRMQGAERIIVQTIKDSTGKYGRWLAIVWVDDEDLNAELIALGLATAY